MLCPRKFNATTLDEMGILTKGASAGTSHVVESCRCEEGKCAWWIGNKVNKCAELAIAERLGTMVDIVRIASEDITELRQAAEKIALIIGSQ